MSAQRVELAFARGFVQAVLVSSWIMEFSICLHQQILLDTWHCGNSTVVLLSLPPSLLLLLSRLTHSFVSPYSPFFLPTLCSSPPLPSPPQVIKSMTRYEIQRQEFIKELVYTERTHLHRLKIMRYVSASLPQCLQPEELCV